MKRHAWVVVVGLVLLLTRAHAARTTEPTPPQPRAVFALLIGYAEAPQGLKLSPLTRAESDVVMMNAFFGTLAPEAVYVHLETAATRSALAVPGRVHVGPATFPAIQASVDALVDELEAAGPADVYVYYAGHGQRVRVDERVQTELFLKPVGAGEGFDGVLGSPLLQRAILARLSADEDTRVHLVVDACQSYFVLEARSSVQQVARARKAPPPIGASMVEHFLDRFERVGALLATNGSQVTYEDPEIGGLFSYAVRSAGIGVADLDRDGQVTYGELERALPWILGQRTGGGPPGLVAPDNDPETPFVDYRGRGVAAVEFAPSEPTRYELTHMPSHQKYAVLYPGRAPVMAWLPRGQEYVTAQRHSPTGPEQWFEFVATSAKFEALRQPHGALDSGARGEIFARYIMARPMPDALDELVPVEPPEWVWQPQTYVAVGLSGVSTQAVGGWMAAVGENESLGVELSAVMGLGRHQGTVRLGWTRASFEDWALDGNPAPALYDALRGGLAYGYVLAEQDVFELTVGPYGGGGSLLMQRSGAPGNGWLIEAGGEVGLRLFVDSGRFAVRADLRAGAQNVSSIEGFEDFASGTDFVIGGAFGFEYEFLAR